MNRYLCMILVSAALSVPAMAQHANAMHGDHNPHHGGAVNMYDMLHYEVVLMPTGGLRVYFTDEMRNDLPATAVSNVRVEIVRPKAAIEPVAMQVNGTGDFWQGRSKPVTDLKSVVRLGFVFRGEAALVEIDGDSWPQLAKAAAAGKHNGH